MISHDTNSFSLSSNGLTIFSRLSIARQKINQARQAINDLERNLIELIKIPNILAMINNISNEEEKAKTMQRYEDRLGLLLDVNKINSGLNEFTHQKISSQKEEYYLLEEITEINK